VPLKERNEQPGDAHKVSAENGGHKISRGQESAFACGQLEWESAKEGSARTALRPWAESQKKNEIQICNYAINP